MFCNKCGKQIPDNTKFCGVCGTPVRVTPVSKTVPVKKPKTTLSVKKLFPWAAALVAAVLVVVLVSSLFGKKTVWLVTKEVWRSDGFKDVVEYSYDKDGRLLEYKDDLGEMRYEYEDGRVVAVEWDGDDYLEYIYDKKGNLVSVEHDVFEAEVTCDKKGRVVEMEFEGDREMTVEYSYHDNGCIEEVKQKTDGYTQIWTYSPTGKLLEEEYYIPDGKYSTKTYEYDSEDRLVEYTRKIHTIDYSMKEIWEYDKKGNWVGYIRNYNGDDLIECEVTGDSTHREAIVTWSAVNFVEEGDTYIEETYDKHGNLIEQITYGENKVRITWEYEKRKIPRNEAVGDLLTDPRYCLFLEV